MCGENGRQIVARHGRRYEAAVIHGLPPEHVAARLTKQIRKKLLGEGADFNRRIDNPPAALV
jgi:hypothetical protein